MKICETNFRNEIELVCLALWKDKNIPFFIPVDLIILLKKLNKISLKDALYFLDGMKVFIKEYVYNEAKKELKEV